MNNDVSTWAGWAHGSKQAEADALGYIQRNYDPPASVIG